MEILLNWFWQTGVLVAGIDLLLSTSRRLRAVASCWIWWMGLALVLLLPVAGQLHVEVASLAIGPSLSTPPPDWAALVLVALWLVWVAVALLRIWRSHRWVVRIRNEAVPLPDQLQSRLPTWRRIRHEGRPARLAASEAIDAAVLVGTRAPLIAVSQALLGRVSERELDQVIAHEWAHAQRRDDVARWIQAIIHVLVGFHPAVRWAFRRLDCARELACDARVVQLTGGAKEYALCLTNLASAASSREPLLASAVLAPSLALRVTTLIAPPLVPRRYRRFASVGLVTAAAVLTALVTRATFVLAPAVSREIDAVVSTLLPTRSHGALWWSGGNVALAGRVSPLNVGHPVGPTPRRVAHPDQAVAQDAGRQTPDAGRYEIVHTISGPPVIQSTSLAADAAVIWQAPASNVALAHADHGPEPGALGVSAAIKAGTATARNSQRAALATAGAFTRAARTLADLF